MAFGDDENKDFLDLQGILCLERKRFFLELGRHGVYFGGVVTVCGCLDAEPFLLALLGVGFSRGTNVTRDVPKISSNVSGHFFGCRQLPSDLFCRLLLAFKDRLDFFCNRMSGKKKYTRLDACLHQHTANIDTALLRRRTSEHVGIR